MASAADDALDSSPVMVGQFQVTSSMWQRDRTVGLHTILQQCQDQRARWMSTYWHHLMAANTTMFVKAQVVDGLQMDELYLDCMVTVTWLVVNSHYTLPSAAC